MEIRNASSPRSPPRERSLVRWGRRLVATAWNSTSGARATISTLKMKPAAAAPSAPFTSSGPALRKVCSLSMISNTAAAKPPPWASENSSSPGGLAATGAGVGRTPRKASGITRRLKAGAAATPRATTSCPSATPTATTRANATRAIDSVISRAA
jgi:hypothetical protein